METYVFMLASGKNYEHSAKNDKNGYIAFHW
jgi:hypothetical protein